MASKSARLVVREVIFAVGLVDHYYAIDVLELAAKKLLSRDAGGIQKAVIRLVRRPSDEDYDRLRQ